MKEMTLVDVLIIEAIFKCKTSLYNDMQLKEFSELCVLFSEAGMFSKKLTDKQIIESFNTYSDKYHDVR